MPPIKIYQIAYSDQTVPEAQSKFDVLDARIENRHDWREYSPIRAFLLCGAMDEETFYGFFSPRFVEKTGLAFDQISDFVGATPDSDAVFTFSPQPDMGAFFLNVFEQNELFDPGFTAACQEFFDAIGYPVRLADLVMDSRHTVFSNYVLARPAFWRVWLDITEKLFAICEGPDTPLKRKLVAETSYDGAVQRKVFLVERIASLLLAVEQRWRVKAYDTFRCAWSASRLSQFPLEAVLSDALKIAMKEQGFPEYATAFAMIRDRLR